MLSLCADGAGEPTPYGGAFVLKELEREGGHYFGEIVEIIERLRAPGGCPWDRKQTMESLRSCITEEAYELADAITRAGSAEPEKIRDALEGTKDLPTVTGMTTINATHDAEKEMGIVEIRNGKKTFLGLVKPEI